jgi:hypothetical protein
VTNFAILYLDNCAEGKSIRQTNGKIDFQHKILVFLNVQVPWFWQHVAVERGFQYFKTASIKNPFFNIRGF